MKIQRAVSLESVCFITDNFHCNIFLLLFVLILHTLHYDEIETNFTIE